MAIYVEHNLTENFINAVGYNDRFMETEIIIDEINRLIVDDKRFLVRLLRADDINVTMKDNNEKIASALLKNLDNPDILKKVSDKIAEKIDVAHLKNLIKTDNKYKNLFGIGKNKEKEPKAPKEKKEKSGAGKELLSKLLKDKDIQTGVGTLIGNSIQKAFQKKKDTKTGTIKVTNSDALKERLKKSQMDKSKNKNPFPKWAKVTLISVGSLTILLTTTLIIIKATRKKKTTTGAVSPETVASSQ